jgi:hypothetical protein
MAIESFNLIEVGVVGNVPRIWQISTSNTLAEVTSGGFLDDLRNQNIEIRDGDMLLIGTKTDPNASNSVPYWFTSTISATTDELSIELLVASATDASTGMVNPVESIAELQAIDTSLFTETGVMCNLIIDAASSPKTASYIYSVANTQPGDDDTIVTPAAITEPAPGRWLKVTDRQIAGIVADTEHGYYAVDAGIVNAYDASITGIIAGPIRPGLRIWLLVNVTNTGASTLAIDGSASIHYKVVAGAVAHLQQ